VSVWTQIGQIVSDIGHLRRRRVCRLERRSQAGRPRPTIPSRRSAGNISGAQTLTLHMSLLFEPLTIAGTTFRNRVWLAPMCQYSAVDGVPNDWHLAHLGARAAGGFGLVLTEATAVSPEGRISPEDVGIWNDEQQQSWQRITDLIRASGARSGIQLAHAGRKASTFRPWAPDRGSVPAADGGWPTDGPSAVAFGDYAVPHELTTDRIGAVVADFVAAAGRAVSAGFDVIEIHAAHGYLIHQFLSPLSNLRADGYGGDLTGRSRLLVEIVDGIRAVHTGALFVRLSATDWAEGGWDVSQSTELARNLHTHGVDLIDVSSGGNVVGAQIPLYHGYQVPFSRQIRRDAGIATAAVGLLTEPAEVEQVLVDGDADAVLLGRAALRDPAWPQRAAHALGLPAEKIPYPPQYVRGAW